MSDKGKPLKCRLVTFPNGNYLDVTISYPTKAQAVGIRQNIAAFGQRILSDYHERVEQGYLPDDVVKNTAVDLMDTIPMVDDRGFNFKLSGTAIPTGFQKVRVITFPTGEGVDVVVSMKGSLLESFKAWLKKIEAEYLEVYRDMVSSGLSHDTAMLAVCESVQRLLSSDAGKKLEGRVKTMDEEH